MKLQPRQIIGLFAIVVFGGGLIWRLTQPSEREVMAQRIASLPTIEVPAPSLPPLDLSVPTAPAPLDQSTMNGLPETDYFAAGSQAAKDDLYCSGVLEAEFNAVINNVHPDIASVLLRDHEALDKAGLAKLQAEKVIEDEGSGAGYSLAYSAKAATDYDAKALRIPVADCSKRAAELK